METSQNLLVNVARLWRMLNKSESFYKTMMSIEELGSIRKLCSQGHMTSVLFKKELCSVYDYNKCYLHDPDLSHITVDVNVDHILSNRKNPGFIVSLIIEQYDKILKSYKDVLIHLDPQSNLARLLNEHMDVLSNRKELLCNEINNLGNQELSELNVA
jgi:hypothetical protein